MIRLKWKSWRYFIVKMNIHCWDEKSWALLSVIFPINTCSCLSWIYHGLLIQPLSVFNDPFPAIVRGEVGGGGGGGGGKGGGRGWFLTRESFFLSHKDSRWEILFLAQKSERFYFHSSQLLFLAFIILCLFFVVTIWHGLVSQLVLVIIWIKWALIHDNQ